MFGPSFIPLLIIVIIVAKTKKIINTFINTETTATYSAKSLKELKLKPNSIFKRLIKRGLLIEILDKYYLDEQKLLEYNNKRKKIMTIVIISVIIVILTEYFIFNYYFNK